MSPTSVTPPQIPNAIYEIDTLIRGAPRRARRCHNVDSMLGQRRRRRPGIESTLCDRPRDHTDYTAELVDDVDLPFVGVFPKQCAPNDAAADECNVCFWRAHPGESSSLLCHQPAPKNTSNMETRFAFSALLIRLFYWVAGRRIPRPLFAASDSETRACKFGSGPFLAFSAGVSFLKEMPTVLHAAWASIVTLSQAIVVVSFAKRSTGWYYYKCLCPQNENSREKWTLRKNAFLLFSPNNSCQQW